MRLAESESSLVERCAVLARAIILNPYKTTNRITASTRSLPIENPNMPAYRSCCRGHVKRRRGVPALEPETAPYYAVFKRSDGRLEPVVAAGEPTRRKPAANAKPVLQPASPRRNQIESHLVTKPFAHDRAKIANSVDQPEFLRLRSGPKFA